MNQEKCSPASICSIIFNDDYRVVTDRTIDSHIKNLRRKLESLDAEQSFIRAVYGVGYRWEADACRIV